ncbi:hypothetical protein AGMMS49944_15090 [Spirochaetia bacterium]|nr:hypothetical protein AGMMS49944_15090 [Spirochaetia bacterium]
MALKPVLYSILLTYADKMHSPTIDSKDLIKFVSKYAQKYAGGEPEWARWGNDTGKRVWEEMKGLTAEGKCRVLAEGGGNKIYLPNFYVDLLEGAYESLDDIAGYPFPSEGDLKLTIPPEKVCALSVITDLIVYLDEPPVEPTPFVALLFPTGIPSALLLSSMIPRRLAEAAMLKLRFYLRLHDNKDYLQNKLIPHYDGKENQLKDVFHRIMIRPLDSLSNLEDGEDFSYLFWTRFCGIARANILKGNGLLPEEITVLQALYILEVMNAWYRTRAVKKKAQVLAFSELDSQFEQPPYAFSMDDIVQFTNSKGTPLLGQYSEADLQEWLTARLHSNAEEELPPMFLITGPGDEKRYIKKNHYHEFSLKFLTDARLLIKRAVSDRWTGILTEYGEEPAMDNDEQFERLLKRLVSESCPDLMAAMTDEKLYLVCDEMERNGGPLPENARFFNPGGKLLPLATLLLIKRKDTLAQIRILLPFWYSIRLFVAIAAFFHRLKNFKLSLGMSKKTQRKAMSPKGDAGIGDKARDKESKEAARKLESELVPYGDTIDDCLENLENRWNTRLNMEARQDLLTDVRTLIRDRLREALRDQRSGVFSRDALEKIALRITEENPTLRELKTEEPLRKYIVLYMTKLLLQPKF